MFEYLQEINPKLYERYLTLEKDIKAKSDSFYDSYLDMLEQFVKHVCGVAEIEFKVHESCGNILSKPILKIYFLSLGVEETLYEKLKDYTQKINKHKHSNQKNVFVEQVISYLSVFYSVSSAFAKLNGIHPPAFNDEYCLELFGILERENQALKSEIKSVDENVYSRLEAIEQGQAKILDELAKHNADSRGEVKVDDKAVVKQFLNNATKNIMYLGDKGMFKSEHTRMDIFLTIAVVLYGISMIFDVWYIESPGFMLVIKQSFLLVLLFVKSSFANSNREISVNTFRQIAYFKAICDHNGIMRSSSLKKSRYNILPFFIYSSVVLNILFFFIDLSEKTFIMWFAVISELAFGVIVFVILKLYYSFIDGYIIYTFTGENPQGKVITIVYYLTQDEWLTAEAFKQKYGFLYND